MEFTMGCVRRLRCTFPVCSPARNYIIKIYYDTGLEVKAASSRSTPYLLNPSLTEWGFLLGLWVDPWDEICHLFRNLLDLFCLVPDNLPNTHHHEENRYLNQSPCWSTSCNDQLRSWFRIHIRSFLCAAKRQKT